MNHSPKDAFEKIARKYAETVDLKPIHIYYERPNLLALLPKDISGLSILDLGCGSGWYAEQLTKLGGDVTAIDASPTMVELAKERLNGKGKVYLADLENSLEFLNGKKFDIVIAPLVIHYIKNWYSLFLNLSNLLKPKGLFIFSTHQPHAEFNMFKLKNYFEKIQINDYWEGIGEVKFYHHTLHELTENLHRAGFIIERMLEPFPLPEMQATDTQMYNSIMTMPWFLFVKAIKK